VVEMRMRFKSFDDLISFLELLRPVYSGVDKIIEDVKLFTELLLFEGVIKEFEVEIIPQWQSSTPAIDSIKIYARILNVVDVLETVEEITYNEPA
jgi:hypothetical protein